MNFPVALPLDGIAGWQFLTRTEEAQRSTFEQSPLLAREVEYFKENIANVITAEELVSDRTLLKVALGAFGLEDEIDKTFYLQTILEQGTESSDALAVRLVDPRYREFSEAFGFGNALGVRTGEFDFGQRITDAYKERQFEVAVGDQSTDLRLALEFKRTIGEYAASSSPDAAWFSIMGNTPLRTVFETAYGLPSSFATLDIERQKEDLADLTQRNFGDDTVAAFLDPANVDEMINRFLARAQINTGPTSGTPGFAALSLLQSVAGNSATGQINLILSNA